MSCHRVLEKSTQLGHVIIQTRVTLERLVHVKIPGVVHMLVLWILTAKFIPGGSALYSTFRHEPLDFGTDARGSNLSKPGTNATFVQVFAYLDDVIHCDGRRR